MGNFLGAAGLTRVWNKIAATYLKLSGGTMTGTLTMLANQYPDSYSGALNMNNSNIYGLNSIYTADASDDQAEGIHFYRDSTHVDSLRMASGSLLFTPNRPLGGTATEYTVYHSGNFNPGNYLPLSGGTMSNTNVVTNLNADLLDGYTAYDFGYTKGSANWDCNEVGTHFASYRFGGSALNAFPGVEWSNMLVIGSGSDTMTQIGAPYNVQELYFRSGTWYGNGGTIRSASWNRIWHENNDGSGSSLDADLVDGEHASAFAHRGTANNLLVAGNEFNFISAGFSGDVYFNFQDENRQSAANVSGYIFCNGRSGTMAYIGASGCSLNNYLRIGGSTTDTMTTATTNPRLVFAEDHTTQAVGIVYTDWDSYRPGKGLKVMDLDGNDPNVWFEVAGNMIATGSVTAGSASDIRLKENISELNIHKVLNILRQLKPKKFNWNSLALELDPMKDKETTHLGYIAQEVEKLIPGAVTDDYFEVYKRLNPIEIIPLLHAAIVYILEIIKP